MIAVRRAESDADLHAWRRVRIAAVPNERAQTVAELALEACRDFERLGYETRSVAIRVRGRLPLPR